VTGTISLVVNLVLITVLIALVSNIFTLKPLIGDQLIGGLYDNFVLMDQAHIRTTIPVKTEVPARFDLPLETDTTVILTEDTAISGARVSLYGGVVTINSAPTDIILPAGTRLPVHLSLVVPVDQTIPVELMVNVDIPLDQTELHQPFVGLQSVVAPYQQALNQAPASWESVVCTNLPFACE
jgi:hypothetical protein